MAIMMIQEFEVDEGERETPNYDAVTGRLKIKEEPPSGLICHTAGFTGRGVFRIASVWESENAWRDFRDGRLAKALMEGGGEGGPPAAEYSYELHDLIRP